MPLVDRHHSEDVKSTMLCQLTSQYGFWLRGIQPLSFMWQLLGTSFSFDRNYGDTYVTASFTFEENKDVTVCCRALLLEAFMMLLL